MQLPTALLQSLQGLPGFNEQAFVDTHNAGSAITSIRLNPVKSENLLCFFADKNIECTPVPWATNGFYLSKRPSFTFDPLFHAGTYYVQEASSMFLEQALSQSVDLSKPLRVLDLCAAPGGKSTHLQSLISCDSLLVSNEVIRQRVNILKDNIIKWGSNNVVVTNNDPKDFAKLEGYFDVIVVDAPCSGSGLFRRDEEAIGEWSESNVTLCSQRQQRILADVMPALKEDGVLIYSTCSYSKSEDEGIVKWLTDELHLAGIKLAIKEAWGVTQVNTSAEDYGYRFWPHKLEGEGFFIAAFQNKNATQYKQKNKNVIKSVTKFVAPLVSDWAHIDKQELININDKIYAWPQVLFSDFNLLLQHLRIIYSGTLLGELKHKKLIPDHALAMSQLLAETTIKAPLDISQSISFLQKNTLELQVQNQGWQVATYENYPLGWMNVLAKRINNYYPKEMRILKSKIDI